MRACLAILLALACAPPPGPLKKPGRIEGSVGVPDGARGDAYVFLYPRGEGPPLRQAVPLYASGVSDLRLTSGDSSYVLAEIPPNPYHLWAFLDTNRTFRADVDVLGQPGAGGRVSAGTDLNLEPGQDLTVDVPLSTPIALEPPGFRLAGTTAPLLTIPDQPALVTISVASSDVGVLEDGHLGFAIALPDPSDPNAGPTPLGTPFVYPQFFLRFVPRPGQVAPAGAEVIVPFTFDSAPYLVALGGNSNNAIVVTSLTLTMISQAEAVTYPPGAAGQVLSPLNAIPVGDYELWCLQKSGQFWRLPNDLGATLPDQATRFEVVHGFAFDGGA